uniref:Uncharacterized protein n=3 Tax=Rhodnius prolixus TaxID=13249 RepID=T1HX80_RHOPR
MVDTFYPRLRTSSDSFEFVLKRRLQKSVKLRRPPPLFNISEQPQNPTLFLEVLVICSTFILWTTSVVLLIFSGYLLYHQFGVSLLTDAYDFLSCMSLQTIASLTLAVTASLVCACHNPGYIHVPRLTKWAIFFIVISIVILSCEIFISLCYKWLPNINLEDKMKNKLEYSVKHPKHLRRWDKMQITLSCCGVKSKEDWVKLGMKIPDSCCVKIKNEVCVSWKEQGCIEAYTSVKTKLLAYLTGSSSVALANCLIIIPVLVKLLTVSLVLTRDARKLSKFKKYNKRLLLHRPVTFGSISHFFRPYITPEHSSTTLVNLFYNEKKNLEKKIERRTVRYAQKTTLSDPYDVTSASTDANYPTENISLSKDFEEEKTLNTDITKPSTSAQ